MDLVRYDENKALHPNGFRNIGATCYFNSVLQALLSCTSFIEEIMSPREKYEDNKTIQLFRKYIELSRKVHDERLETKDGAADLVNFSPELWKNMVLTLCRKKKIPISQFMQGQQCAGEGYHYLLETMEELHDIQNLFLHRYKSLIRCFDCDKWVSDVDNMYSLFEVEPDLQLEQLAKFEKYTVDTKDMQEFLAKQSSYVDENYKCPECKRKGEKYKLTMLVMVPEIMFVMAKKYTLDRKLNVNTAFPKKLSFNEGEKKIMYEAVAQIEHAGGRHGGHYWAICRRKDGWYTLNDGIVQKSEFKPTANTYIVVYHLM